MKKRIGFSVTTGLLLLGLRLGIAEEVRGEVPRPPRFVTAEEWGSQPDPIGDDRRHTPRYVTLHHAGVVWTPDRDPVTFLRNLQAWGKRRPELEPPPRNTYWPDLPYHFLIASDGQIFAGRPVIYEPESNTQYELAGHLGVELMGNFEEQRPSQPQVESAVRLVAWLLAEHGLPVSAISTHAKVAAGQTSCPGRDFARYLEGEPAPFPEWVAQVLQGQTPQIELGPPLEGGPTQVIGTSAAESATEQAVIE
ncbi:peptidoglycan recognition protein family protein [Botrimarina hoheduenensis]|uniref:N-acetylmuramoyl-L-alanine amidase n=1 Tax=Botrimarina hoheduenensis TaxID=2528000 RepID=A0A5C5WBF6_9BACT|nr:peptidoglycan recognition family protein [Botrimarina hoheduenensis]TWT47409.1 N-acetylmuramoyl-L-alanine amidase [Botrimarina hoheduenensis]